MNKMMIRTIKHRTNKGTHQRERAHLVENLEADKLTTAQIARAIKDSQIENQEVSWESLATNRLRINSKARNPKADQDKTIKRMKNPITMRTKMKVKMYSDHLQTEDLGILSQGSLFLSLILKIIQPKKINLEIKVKSRINPA